MGATATSAGACPATAAAWARGLASPATVCGADLATSRKGKPAAGGVNVAPGCATCAGALATPPRMGWFTAPLAVIVVAVPANAVAGAISPAAVVGATPAWATPGNPLAGAVPGTAAHPCVAGTLAAAPYGP